MCTFNSSYSIESTPFLITNLIRELTMYTDIINKTVKSHIVWKETLHQIKQLGETLERNNFPSELSKLNHLLYNETLSAFYKEYPIEQMILDISEVDGIPEGFSVMSQKELCIPELKRLGGTKKFIVVTLSSPSIGRFIDDGSLLGVLWSEAFDKWLYPSEVRQYIQSFHSPVKRVS